MICVGSSHFSLLWHHLKSEGKRRTREREIEYKQRCINSRTHLLLVCAKDMKISKGQIVTGPPGTHFDLIMSQDRSQWQIPTSLPHPALSHAPGPNRPRWCSPPQCKHRDLALFVACMLTALIPFMPIVISTSGRLYPVFIRLFLQAHRDARALT